MKEKIIYLLTGPKGSGKSYIGSVMDNRFNIKFIRVEDSVKKIKQGRTIADENYLSEAFQIIEFVVRSSLEKYPEIVFESTGLTDYFDHMYLNLKQDYRLITIGIVAGKDLCLSRVKSRDKSIHIDISDEQVMHINEMVELKNLKTEYKINNNKKSEEELIKDINKILLSINSNNSKTQNYE